MALSRVTVVLIPGAFTTANSLSPLAAALQQQGCETRSVSLPSVNAADPLTATCSADARYVQQEIIEPILAAHRDVVVFGHSYGGVVAGGSAYGLSRDSEGHAGGGTVLGVMLHAGMIIPENSTLEQVAGGQLPPNIKIDEPSPGLCVSVPDGAEPQATLAFTSPAPKSAWSDPHFAGRLAYIRTMRDESFPPDFQSAVIAQSGAQWQIEDVPETHESFLEDPARTVEAFKKYVSTWTK